MSVADPFAALGFLPFCHESLPELDVTGWDYVAPLTLAELMQVYWNLENVIGTATLSAPFSPPSYAFSASASGGVLDRPPFARACGPGRHFSEEYDEDPDSSQFAQAVVSATSGDAGEFGNLVRLMDGASFIGYGVGYYEDAANQRIGAAVSLVGWAFSDDTGEQNCSVLSAVKDSTSEEWENYSADIVTLGGMNFVKLQYGITPGLGVTTSTDITGLGFYTYPAP